MRSLPFLLLFSLLLQGCGNLGKGYKEVPPDEVIRRHIQFLNEENVDAAESCIVKERRNQIDWQFDIQKNIRLLHITEEADSSFALSYLQTGRGSITHPVKLKVYSVQLERNLEGFIQSSDINFWHYYVIKQTNESPWLIDDWGI